MIPFTFWVGSPLLFPLIHSLQMNCLRGKVLEEARQNLTQVWIFWSPSVGRRWSWLKAGIKTKVCENVLITCLENRASFWIWVKSLTMSFTNMPKSISEWLRFFTPWFYLKKYFKPYCKISFSYSISKQFWKAL